MGLLREKLFGIEIETTEGEEETLDANSYAGEFRECEADYSHEEYQRDNDRASMTRRPSLVSKHGLKIRGKCECVGGAVGSPAPWHKILRACGFGQTTANVNRFGYTTLTGTAPKIGDVVGNNASQGSATKLGIVIYIDTTNSKVWLHATTGTFANADAITNYSRTNAFTLNTTATAAGYHFFPQTELSGSRPPSATAALRDMGQIHKMVGSRGNLTMSWMHGKPVMLDFELTGIPVTQNDDGTPIEPGDTITPPDVGGVPQVVQALPMQLIQSTTVFGANATQWDILLNNTVTLRETATDTCLHNSGYLPARITDRNLQITVDPEHVLPADGIDFIGFVRKRTPVRMNSRCAKPNHVNGSIISLAPTAMMSPEQSAGDRGGIRTRNIRLDCTGNRDDELRIYHIFDPA